MTYITNDCLAAFIYKKLGVSYQSPLIGMLFPNDKQYVKFCKNFDHYIKVEPTFGEAKFPIKYMGGHKTPPIMFLEDIEIHWVHKDDAKYVLMRWKERLNDITDNPFFLWSDEQMFDGYSDELRKEFEAIPHSKFIKVADIPNYQPGSLQYNELGDYVIGHKTQFINFHGEG